MPKLHINIVVLNGWEYTKVAIDSIKTKHKYKLRIIDQESSDGTQDRCRDLGIDCYRKEPRVSLSEAWNFGIQESLKDPECEYILNPNNDIIFHKATIDNLIEAMEDTGYAMVTGNNVAPIYQGRIDEFKSMAIKEEDREFDKRPITNWKEEGPDFSCYMIKKDIVEKVGWFDENFYPAYYEDNCMHIRMLKAGLHAKRIMRAPYYHYGSMTVRINPRLDLHSGRTVGVFTNKWGAMPPQCMDGGGYQQPYNDPTKSFKYWKGSEKYHELENSLFGKVVSK